MTFLNPHILWALPFVAVPVIIYYLMRFRSLEEPWGANYVLERALERLRKSLYLEEVLLIALRCLACGLLVVAFARPLWTAGGAGLRGGDRHHVVILDASYSMRADAGQGGGTDGEHDRWSRATRVVSNLVENWGRGAKWSLLVMGELPGESDGRSRNLRWVVEGKAIGSAENAVQTVAEIRPGESDASLPDALESVSARFGEDQLDLYILSDDQATTWRGVEDGQWPGLSTTPMYRINLAGADRDNVAVTAVEPASRIALSCQQIPLFVSVRNFGPRRVRDRRLRILCDGKFREEATVSLLPGQEADVMVSVTFEEPGSHRVLARLDRDRLAFDDSLVGCVEVVENIDVLVLSDPASEEKFESPLGFFRVMERLVREEKAGKIRFHGGADSLTPEKLNDIEVVTIDGGRSIGPELGGILRAWLAEGGGLILAVDDRADPEQWNAHLGRDGLLPAPLKTVRVNSFDSENYRTLARSRFGDAMLRPFAKVAEGDISRAKFFAWAELGESRPGATVLARFADDSPFLVGQELDPGRVLLMTGGMGGRNNNLVVREFFVPLLYRLFSGAASGTIFPRSLREDRTARLLIERPDIVRGITFDPGDDEPIALRPPKSDGPSRVAVDTDAVRVGGSGACSMLVMRRGDRRRVWYGVQRPRTDSDLRPVPDEWLAGVRENLNLTEVGGWSELQEALRSEQGGREWYVWAILALLAALFGEMLLQRRFV
jgi:hypothetical protein